MPAGDRAEHTAILTKHTIAATLLLQLCGSMEGEGPTVLRWVGSVHEPAVLQLSIGSGASNARIRELQLQIYDYSSLISDPVCPLDMRDLLVVEMAQIVTALLLLCEQIDCAFS